MTAFYVVNHLLLQLYGITDAYGICERCVDHYDQQLGLYLDYLNSDQQQLAYHADLTLYRLSALRYAAFLGKYT